MGRECGFIEEEFNNDLIERYAEAAAHNQAANDFAGYSTNFGITLCRNNNDSIFVIGQKIRFKYCLRTNRKGETNNDS